MQTHPIVLIAIGIVVRYLIAMRKFNRRGVGGLQHYPNFLVAVITTFLEWLFKWIANALVVLGLVLLIV